VNRTHRLPLGVVVTMLLSAGAALAQTTAPEAYKPVVGMPGKDAVWVPTTAAMVEKMLDMAKVTPKDFVIDLGSGDGRTIIAAARRGVPGMGVEFNADLVEFSKRRAAEAGVGDKASFVQGDMYAADISKATVLALFLLPSNLEKLAPKFLALPPGSRIVANTFWIPDWDADESETLQSDCDSWCTSHLFIIPANVQGSWRMPQGQLALTQKFQKLTGTLTAANGTTTPVTGRLRGTAVTLNIGDAEYAGQVQGNTIKGSAKGGSAPSSWTATRASK